MQKGKIGVTTENIFPVIKKFLYSEHDIFLRELVSNAVDATQKLKALASSGEFKGDVSGLKVTVEVDEAAHTVTISDEGIGMTEDEVTRYINQIAFSGAEEFLAKYKDQTNIIGHFGLGFYSSFMVASQVDLNTLSYKDGAEAVKWSCDGSPEYTLEKCDKAERGTRIVLHLAEDSYEFASRDRIGALLGKYCRFLPVPIVFGKEQEWKDGKYVDTDKDRIINETSPLWTRKPSELKEEDYADFYRMLYPMAEEPLFHIHLNVDYPFTLTGILYFPKIRNNFEIQKNKIQLYSNQVFVTDSVEGVVPEFLTLLHGVIDSPDIPLNVSRSYLQGDPDVKKISSHITKKVSDRLSEIFKSSRDDFEKKWDDLKIFIQYGIITDEKFADKAGEFTLLKNNDGKYFTFAEYKELVAANQTDKDGNIIMLYTNDPVSQDSFIAAARDRGYDILVMDGNLDNHYISYLENKNEKCKFVRVDSDVIDKLIRKDEDKPMALSTDQQNFIRPLFETVLPADDKTHFNVTFEPLSGEESPVLITQNEFMRRMKEMSQMGGSPYAFYGQMPESYTVVVNGNHHLILQLWQEAEKEVGTDVKALDDKISVKEKERKAFEEVVKDKKEEEFSPEERERRGEIDGELGKLRSDRYAKLSKAAESNTMLGQIVDLALLANGMLKGEKLTKFIKRSVDMIGK